MISVIEAIPAARRRASGQIRVASVPAGHVYVRHLSDPDGGDAVVRLPDIPPADGRRVPGGWWPPAMLDADWIAAHHDTFDVFHVHFGFDAKTPDELRAVAGALERAGVPLVVTVHDLRNPHHPSPELHDAQLGVLIEHAAAVITLTPGAAREIAARWGRRRDRPAAPARRGLGHDGSSSPRPRRVRGRAARQERAGQHGRDGRRRRAGGGGGALPGARLQINVHHEVFEPGSHYHDPETGEALRQLAGEHVEVREHEYFSDDELWAYLSSLDVSVLPYRFGTHSGWLEACVDLGTAVIAPSCGFYAEQQPLFEYRHDETGLDAGSLAAAVRRRVRRAPARRASVVERREQRRALSAAHEALYARVIG